ncbi:MAG: hypothetical protein QXX77_05790, partial [Candidatus Methanosuratincola sp.]
FVMRALWITALVISMLVFAAPSRSEFIVMQRDALRGLPPLFVVVERLEPAAVEAGLSESTIKQEVERRLRASGVRVLDEGERLPGAPFLYVRITAYEVPGTGVYSYSVALELRELVTLVRNPRASTYASTWESQGVAFSTGIRDRAREYLAKKVDEFVDDWLAANP